MAMLFGYSLFGVILCFLLSAGAAFAARKYLWEKYAVFEPPANGAVLITGTSTGFGKIFALDLARRGMLVFAGVRKRADGEKLLADAGSNLAGKVVPVILDVTKREDIDAAVHSVKHRLDAEGKKLFAVVNNAGLSVVGAAENVPMDKVRWMFEVNFWGSYEVSRAFLPMLRESPKSRLVFITSYAGLAGIPWVSTYCSTKHAVEAIADGFRAELRPTNVKVSVIEPGFFETEIITTIAGKNAEGEAKTDEKSKIEEPVAAHYAKEVARYQSFVGKFRKYMQGPEHVSRLLQSTLFSYFPPARAIIGMDVTICFVLSWFVPEWLNDLVLQAYKTYDGFL